MAQTEHLGLHQWEASDSFLRTDFNTDFAKIDAAVGGLITVGTYTGNAPYGNQTLKQEITLGFQPRMVLVWNMVSSSSNFNVSDWSSSNVGLALPGHPQKESDSAYTTLEITETGFRAGGFQQYLNSSGVTYAYLAIR